jgi:hypothetical protein
MNHSGKRRESVRGVLAHSNTARRGSILQSFSGQEPKSLMTVKLQEVEASFDSEMLMLDGYFKNADLIFPSDLY